MNEESIWLGFSTEIRLAGPQTLSKMTTTLKLSRPDETLSTYKYILLWLVKLVIADPHLMLHVSNAQEWCGDGFCVVGSPAECAACWRVVTRLPGLCGCFLWDLGVFVLLFVMWLWLWFWHGCDFWASLLLASLMLGLQSMQTHAHMLALFVFTCMHAHVQTHTHARTHTHTHTHVCMLFCFSLCGQWI